MKKFRIISSVLVLMMLLGVMFPAGVFSAAAAESDDDDDTIDYINTAYTTPEEKLGTMEMVYSKYDTEIWYQKHTGEVAFKNTKTGQIILSNPYDVGDSSVTTASATVKARILSQIILTYNNLSSSSSYELTSYSDAAVSSQILMKNIKGGIRVEYTIGETAKRKVVPRRISEERFQTEILEKIDNAYIKGKVDKFYLIQDLKSETITDKTRKEMIEKYPIVEQYAIRVLISDINDSELNRLEGYIKQYTDYTLQDMLDDHEATGYVLGASSPPLFKLALEYYVEEDGVTAKLSGRGIQFDASTYALKSIDILPYMGAGRAGEGGYAFVPDGSGATIKFSDVSAKNVTIAAQLYGNDYAFHSEEYGTPYGGNMEIWRTPVFGVVRESSFSYSSEVEEKIPLLDEDDKPVYDEHGDQVFQTKKKTVTETKDVKHGYSAIITEGDSLGRLTFYGGGTVHPYQTVYLKVFPRQSDSYPLNGLTVSGNAATFTVDCDRKYVGNYSIKYSFLYGDDATYVGMAKNYRKYLIANGYMEALDTANSDIPLYIETLGDVDATERIIGVPVNVKKELTTFKDAQTILKDLIDANVKNLSLKYTGWYNGGLYNTPPTKLSVDGVLGGDNGLKELVSFTKSNGIGFYPDFDFLFVHDQKIFDRFDARTQGVQTIEGRVARMKVYNARAQAYGNRGDIVISTNFIDGMWNDIKEKYNSFDIGAISLSTIGKYLSSDQNEDAPLNREESKAYTLDFLKDVASSGEKIMVSGGNAYTYQYASVILDMPLESSNRNYESEQVPFLGIALHGYKEYAGKAINLAGDYKTNLLRIIESGANPYFAVAYQNTSKLKDTDFSSYYSIRYDIWKDDIIATYNELNGVLAKVKTATIENHEFVGYRIVRTTYSNGTKFILNFNNYEVEFEGEKIPALGYLVK